MTKPKAKRHAVVGNHLSRAQRLQRWLDATAEGKRHDPREVSGDKHARYRWLQWIAQSELPAMTRLVAHTLVLHGRNDGTNLFPSTRTLSRESGLSERSVSTHLDVLIRRGWLGRYERKRDKLWACGFLYVLQVPAAVLRNAKDPTPAWEKDRDWEPNPTLTRAERDSAPGTEGHSAPRAEGDAVPKHGAEPDSARSPQARLPMLEVLKLMQ